MSVRRLAERQPPSFEFTPDNRAWADRQIAKYPPGRQASAVLSLLWRAQTQNNYWLPKPAIEKVAEILDMPFIRVLEVATFYTMFNLAPVGRQHVQLCGTTPCMLRGAEDLKKVCEKRIGPQGHVSADGALSWVEVECLGACCNAPMAQINDDYYEDLTPESFGKLLDDLAAGRPVKKGSQIGRVSSEPVGGLTSLTSLYGVDGKGVQAPANDSAPDATRPAAAGGEDAPVATIQKSATISDIDAHAAVEEAEIKAKLATLRKDATSEEKANAVGARPQGLAAARTGAADDLQRIKGIGPANEKRLRELGIFHFDQIAGWTRPEIRWVGTYLSFPGRIDREQWVSQAGNLAAGGAGSKETGEHSPAKV
jgi:NADH-quinone oxidoreductase subunit E